MFQHHDNDINGPQTRIKGREVKLDASKQKPSLLFSLAAVGVVHHHSTTEAGSHCLRCDKLKLEAREDKKNCEKIF